MEPVTMAIVGGMAASTLATGIMSYMNSKDANQMAASERAKIARLVNKLQDPQFDWSQIDPEEYQVVGKYIPEVASYIEEKAPQVLQGQSVGRDAEQQALNRWLEMSRSGRDDIFDIQQRQAARTGAAEQQGQLASLQDLQQRQGGGSIPMSAALRTIMSNRSGEMAEQGALDAANRRTQALGNVGQLGGQIRQSDQALEEKNANIINDFNRRLAQNSNEYNQYKAGILNNAQMANLAQQQKTNDANVGLRNEAQQDNLSNRNQLVQQQFQNNISKINARQGVANQNIGGIYDNAKTQQSLYGGINDALLKGGGAYADYAQKDKELELKYPKR